MKKTFLKHCIALCIVCMLVACKDQSTLLQPSPKPSVLVWPSSTPAVLDPAVTKTSMGNVEPTQHPTIPPTLPQAPKLMVGILHSTNDPAGTSDTDYILDQTGSVVGRFNSGSSYLSLADDPCFVYGLSQVPNGILVDKMDLEGNIQERFEFQIQEEHSHPWNLYSLSLSPDGQWISYVWPSGEGGDFDPLNSEKLHLELLDVKQNAGKPFSVTSFGGATQRGGSWSPDGKTIAFSDRDLQGSVQIYVLNLSTKQKIQVSNFNPSEVSSIKEVKYSPDGKKIAFLGLASNLNNSGVKETGVVGIIYVDEQKTEFFELPEDYFQTRNTLWWNSASDEFVTVIEAASSEEKFWGDFVVWFDLIDKEEIKFYPDQGVQSFVISEVFPLQRIDKLILLGKEPYLYDAANSNLKEIYFPNLCCSFFDYFVHYYEVNLNSCPQLR